MGIGSRRTATDGLEDHVAGPQALELAAHVEEAEHPHHPAAPRSGPRSTAARAPVPAVPFRVSEVSSFDQDRSPLPLISRRTPSRCSGSPILSH